MNFDFYGNCIITIYPAAKCKVLVGDVMRKVVYCVLKLEYAIEILSQLYNPKIKEKDCCANYLFQEYYVNCYILKIDCVIAFHIQASVPDTG